MIAQIQQAIDIICPCSSQLNNNNQGESESNMKIVLLSNDSNRRRPLYQIQSKKDLETIQKEFQLHHRILLPTLNTYSYYSCEKNEMEQKINQHMTMTNAYRFIMELDDITQDHFDTLLLQRDYYIATTLNNLFQYHCINYTQWQQLISHQSRTRYDLLYFLPVLHQV